MLLKAALGELNSANKFKEGRLVAQNKNSQLLLQCETPKGVNTRQSPHTFWKSIEPTFNIALDWSALMENWMTPDRDWLVVAHIFNPSTQEAEDSRSLSSRPARSTE